jgi:hypothetical protein
MQSVRTATDKFSINWVTVICSDSELRFAGPTEDPTADPTPIRLEGQDILILRFQGISTDSDMVPGVAFSGPDTLTSPLGPFQESLQTTGQIILRGNSGLTGTFRCTALLSPKMRGEEPPLSSSNQLPVDNGLDPSSAKEFRVLVSRPKVDPSSVEGPGMAKVKVEVQPQMVSLFSPDPVIWNFVFADGLEPRDYAPLLYHDRYPSLPDGSGPFGPFESLSTAGLFEPLGDGSTLGYRLITSGNNHVHRQFHFMVGVRPLSMGTSNGIFSVVDPIIDNIGPPQK